MTDPPSPRLAAEVRGAGPRVVLVHGFTQTARCWGPVATDLAADHEVVAVDAPGHGASAHVRADLPATADLLGRFGGGAATWLGYSMGARMALQLALDHPGQVGRLVLVSGTAGIEDPGERAARRAADEALAARLEAEGVARFLDGWLAQPLFAGLGPGTDDRAERLTNPAAGLAASLRLAGTGTQVPSWDRLGDLAVPVLVVAGADDAKFTALAHRLGEAVGPGATVALVPGAGHSAHRERPEAFLAALRPWLAETA